MKYLMLHAVEESRLDHLPPQIEGELEAWLEEMVGRGIELDGSRLHPTTDATTVRVAGGEVQVTDGPFAETKEQIAGYDVIDCPDIDTAIAVASAHPTLHIGAIEVRAFEDGMPNPEVSETVADGKRRYLMLVCADMRRAMAAARDADTRTDTRTDSATDSEPVGEDDDPMGIDAWVDSVADRRVYGWALAFPNSAVTVRRVDGRVVTTDGPFAETKEQVAGYDLLECLDLDQALAAAGTHPVACRGAIEIRPLRD
jgi:hypothetical protein